LLYDWLTLNVNFEAMNIKQQIKEILIKHYHFLDCEDVADELLNLHSVINWVAVSEKLPPRPDEDYLVCVRNKNKEGGIPIQDIGNFSSDGVWIKQNTWEDVVFWAELPKPPCL